MEKPGCTACAAVLPKRPVDMNCSAVVYCFIAITCWLGAVSSYPVTLQGDLDKFESSFYSNPDLRKVRAPEETQPTVDVATLIQQLQNSPELATALAALLPEPS